MAEKEKDTKEDKGKLCHISMCVVENGYKINCNYEATEKTLSQRAGWVECPTYCNSKDYVEKTKAAVLKTLAEIL